MTVEEQIQAFFYPLNDVVGTMPLAGAMKSKLAGLAPGKGTKQIPATEEILKLYASSSVEMWLRAVHSFLISCALTRVSPIWSSVSGYYSSHYAVRGFAHLLGIYQLHQRGFIVRLQPSRSGFVCDYSEAKGKQKKEHSFYWVQVKRHPLFSANQLFTENPENVDQSDCAHRNYANYIDHLMGFPRFDPLDYDELKERIDFISKMELAYYPIPDVARYADVESVQIVAYHRLVEYRELLNLALLDTNRFWRIHREPEWARGVMTFQRVKLRPLAIETT